MTQALICLECREVKMFGPKGELHCDLSIEAGQRLAQLLSPYQKNRSDRRRAHEPIGTHVGRPSHLSLDRDHRTEELLACLERSISGSCCR